MQNNDLIRRGELLEKLRTFEKSTELAGNVDIAIGYSHAQTITKEAPTVDAVQMAPVKIERYDNGQGRCPLCKTDIPFQVVNDKWAFEPYCPHCAAKMDLEDGAK